MARARKSFGLFERAGGRRTAYSPAEAVQLEYDGWSRVEETPEPAPAKTAKKPTGK